MKRKTKSLILLGIAIFLFAMIQITDYGERMIDKIEAFQISQDYLSAETVHSAQKKRTALDDQYIQKAMDAADTRITVN